MGKYKYLVIYGMFIGIFRKKKKHVTSEEPKNPHSTKSQMPTILLPCPAPELHLVLRSLLQSYTTALVISNL